MYLLAVCCGPTEYASVRLGGFGVLHREQYILSGKFFGNPHAELEHFQLLDEGPGCLSGAGLVGKL